MTEIWKDIKGYKGLYQVSSKGRVKSLVKKGTKKERILKGGINTTGYYQVQLRLNCKNNMLLISRLVCLAFHKNPEGKRTVNHKDGNTLNNYADNLEWATYSENQLHAYKELGKKSKINLYSTPKRKFSKHEILDIRNKLQTKQCTILGLSTFHNVSANTIWQIKHRVTYFDS